MDGTVFQLKALCFGLSIGCLPSPTGCVASCSRFLTFSVGAPFPYAVLSRLVLSVEKSDFELEHQALYLGILVDTIREGVYPLDP